MSAPRTFLVESADRARDEVHRHKILRAISSYEKAVGGMKAEQFRDWQAAREEAGKIKQAALDRLPALLERFESRIESRGARVIWAEDAASARESLDEIIERHGVERVVKSKSMTTEELELNSHLEARDVEVLESDLGELIVQLAGEKPYHIVTPAMHKSREEIAELFAERLGTPPDASAEELTLAAREHLRQAYVTAGMGITGANFLVADEGAVVMVENEGNGRLSMACPPVHVVIAGIEKILPRLADLPLFLPLLATSGTGQELTGYNSIVRGPRAPGEVDGPEHLYVILLDNGRSDLYGDPDFREALRCIRCGACLNACPVYRSIGGHAYRTTYQGPIGSVITPHLRDLSQFGHLSQASSLCGACTDVCPVRIDLHHLLLENRWRSRQAGHASWKWRSILRAWSWAHSSRRRVELLGWLGRIGQSIFRQILPARLARRVPELAPRSFARQWKERGR